MNKTMEEFYDRPEGTCPFCGKEFEDGDDMDAETKEGIHRANEHHNAEESKSEIRKQLEEKYSEV